MRELSVPKAMIAYLPYVENYAEGLLVMLKLGGQRQHLFPLPGAFQKRDILPWYVEYQLHVQRTTRSQVRVRA